MFETMFLLLAFVKGEQNIQLSVLILETPAFHPVRNLKSCQNI